jgi:hypothetical protein
MHDSWQSELHTSLIKTKGVIKTQQHEKLNEHDFHPYHFICCHDRHALGANHQGGL